ncbi:MAG TPA: squalene/phytoene synthase family protein [Thermoanaerobaculia bacterium]|nr:squalene/phytoene synthase family protein [Thermoanaerobaculia bacterium]
MTRSDPLREAYSRAESIASRDLNNLYLTSRFFADPVRYRAFCAFYAVMRRVDDRVDELCARSGVPAAERERVAAEVAAWRRAVEAVDRGRSSGGALAAVGDPAAAGELLAAFADAHGRFRVPLALWRNFFAAMDRDLEDRRFESYGEFLEYAEGATVAPTTIYLLLLTSRPAGAPAADPAHGPAPPPGGSERARYEPLPGFDFRECGRQLGLFAYLTHILRDLPQDLAAGERGLVYLARDDMARFGVTEATLRRDLARGRAGEGARALLAELGGRARAHLERGRALLAALEAELSADCAFILALIVAIYDEALARIAAQGFDPFPERHRLGLREKRRIVARTAREAGFPMAAVVGGVVAGGRR